MTDNEIVKACKNCLHYEACKGTYSSAKGEEDILYDFDGEMYANSGCEDFIDKDLINRQKAEIERLRKIVGFTPARGSGKSPFLNAVLDNVRAEAYREFAELAKSELFNTEYCLDKYHRRAIDKLLSKLEGAVKNGNE